MPDGDTQRVKSGSPKYLLSLSIKAMYFNEPFLPLMIKRPNPLDNVLKRELGRPIGEKLSSIVFLLCVGRAVRVKTMQDDKSLEARSINYWHEGAR